MHALLIGRGDTGVEGAQLEGFGMYRAALQRRLGLRTSRTDLHDLEAIERLVSGSGADVAFIMVDFKIPPATLIETFRRLYEQSRRPKLIFLDYYAQTSSPYFGVLPYVDRYAKRQVLRDRSRYQQALGSGYVFTDYFSRHFDFDLGSWHFGSTIAPEHQDKLVVAWNLAVVQRYRWVLRANRWWRRRWRQRRIDVNSRLGLDARAPWEWYQEYRTRSQASVDALASRFQLSGKERVSRRRFQLELRDSKIIFSPFGWGEVCFRDFEAVIWGALLVKPSMAHLETRPDIFVDRVTYVPIEWDNSDLEAKCAHYLEHPDEAEQIVESAQRRLAEYYEGEGFVDDVARVLSGL
ncbi:MAG: glycosyltransferase family 1 protein [Deltaproteobacteria bacterium]|nr:glycosyltransferase family 1 protein [Deltaproteobacteria bacterium]